MKIKDIWRFCSLGMLSTLLFISIPHESILGQETDSTFVNHRIFPILFYGPETNLGLGITGMTTFKLDGESAKSPSSQILYSMAYTFKNQLIVYFPFQVFKENGKTRIKGELAFYKFFYNYYGIGGSTQLEDLEKYNVSFPRIYLSYSRRITDRISLGIGHKFDYFNITEIEPNGMLDTDRPIGYDGGIKSNMFYLAFYDTRDNVISSSSGFYTEVEYTHSLGIPTDKFSYRKFNLDMRYFIPIQEDLVVANQVVYANASSGTPFFDLPFIASSKRARGWDDRRFLVYEFLSMQSELRFPVYKNLKGASFITNSIIPNDDSDQNGNNVLWSLGFGIRYQFSKVDKTRFRLDFAFSKEGQQFYLRANEAF